MTEWHRLWQSNFDETEIRIGNRWADAVVSNIVLEFQHSKISDKNIRERNLNYKEHGYTVYWIVECSSSTSGQNITRENGLFYRLTFDDNHWKH